MAYNADYVPGSDWVYVPWLGTFVTVATAKAGILGLPVDEVSELETLRNTLVTKLDEHQDAQYSAMAATAAKNAARVASVTLLRQLVRKANASPNMTDEIRRELGLKPADTENTTSEGVGSETPLLKIEPGIGVATIHFGPKPGSVRGNAKPAWATGALIYRRKATENEYQLVGAPKKSPFKDTNFNGPATDYVYYARYQGKRETDLGDASEEVIVAVRGLSQAA